MPVRFVNIVFFISSFCCSLGLLRTITAGEDNTYRTEKRLFHIERSKNKNIVCYDLNTDITGKPDAKNPLSVYWINREEYPGRHGELSFIEQKLAYGYTVTGKKDEMITIGINAAKDKIITIEQDEHGFFCRIEINSKPSVLTKIFIKTKTPNSLQVEYVEINGFDQITGMPVNERITP